jgi:hypothetical protein
MPRERHRLRNGFILGLIGLVVIAIPLIVKAATRSRSR